MEITKEQIADMSEDELREAAQELLSSKTYWKSESKKIIKQRDSARKDRDKLKKDPPHVLAAAREKLAQSKADSERALDVELTRQLEEAAKDFIRPSDVQLFKSEFVYDPKTGEFVLPIEGETDLPLEEGMKLILLDVRNDHLIQSNVNTDGGAMRDVDQDKLGSLKYNRSVRARRQKDDSADRIDQLRKKKLGLI